MKLNKLWREKPCYLKIVNIIGIIISLLIIVLASLQLTGIYSKAINIFEPLLGILMLIQVIENWKKNKVIAYLSLAAALFIFLVAIIIWVK